MGVGLEDCEGTWQLIRQAAGHPVFRYGRQRLPGAIGNRVAIPARKFAWRNPAPYLAIEYWEAYLYGRHHPCNGVSFLINHFQICGCTHHVEAGCYRSGKKFEFP